MAMGKEAGSSPGVRRILPAWPEPSVAIGCEESQQRRNSDYKCAICVLVEKQRLKDSEGEKRNVCCGKRGTKGRIWGEGGII